LKVLEGKFVRLRAPEPEDLEFLYQWENDTTVWQVSNTIAPFSRFTLKQYIETSHLDIYETRQLRFMIDLFSSGLEATKTIGTIDLFDFEPYHNRAGIGILIGDTSERGKGFANDALITLIRYAFSILKLHQLFCNISVENEQSLHLFQSNGFVIIGEKKDWLKNAQDGWTGEYLLQLINPQ
jgi:diamine N-acetyltransferase